jgi:hypothetical protein
MAAIQGSCFCIGRVSIVWVLRDSIAGSSCECLEVVCVCVCVFACMCVHSCRVNVYPGVCVRVLHHHCIHQIGCPLPTRKLGFPCIAYPLLPHMSLRRLCLCGCLRVLVSTAPSSVQLAQCEGIASAAGEHMKRSVALESMRRRQVVSDVRLEVVKVFFVLRSALLYVWNTGI